MKEIFEYLEFVELFYDKGYITLQEYYKIKSKILDDVILKNKESK